MFSDPGQVVTGQESIFHGYQLRDRVKQGRSGLQKRIRWVKSQRHHVSRQNKGTTQDKLRSAMIIFPTSQKKDFGGE